MSREIEQLEYIINGAETRRWHTVPVAREQCVGLHSFHVAWLCFWLMSGNVRPHLLLAALAHDLPEHLFGDIPSPAKRAMGKDAAAAWDEQERISLSGVGLDFGQYLTDEERRVLKLADVLEYALYAIRERRLGNQAFGDERHQAAETSGSIMTRIRKYLNEVVDIYNGREVKLVNYVNDMWEQANGSQ